MMTEDMYLWDEKIGKRNVTMPAQSYDLNFFLKVPLQEITLLWSENL